MTFAIDLFEECKHVYLHFLLLYIFCCVTLGEPLENFTRILFCIIFLFLGCVLLVLLYILLPPRFSH